MKEHQYFVYIMPSRSGTLYIGMTNNIYRRALQHKSGQIEGFASKYHCTRLVHYASFDDVHRAIGREKRTKRLDSGKEDSVDRIKKPQMGESRRTLGSPNAVRWRIDERKVAPIFVILSSEGPQARRGVSSGELNAIVRTPSQAIGAASTQGILR